MYSLTYLELSDPFHTSWGQEMVNTDCCEGMIVGLTFHGEGLKE